MPDCKSCKHRAIRRSGTGEAVLVCAHPRLLAALHLGPPVNRGPTGLLMNIAPRLCEKHNLYEPGDPAPLPQVRRRR